MDQEIVYESSSKIPQTRKEENDFSVTQRRKTPRKVNDRKRFVVMRRDSFKCCLCGTSPALKLGVVLVVDHIISWDSGGETVIENLQTLCERCNSGKSNLSIEIERKG